MQKAIYKKPRWNHVFTVDQSVAGHRLECSCPRTVSIMKPSWPPCAIGVIAAALVAHVIKDAFERPILPQGHCLRCLQHAAPG